MYVYFYIHIAGFSEQEVKAMVLARKNEKIKNGKKNENKKIDNAMDQYFGCKYLTSSELLSLQIRDPFFRQQILAQVLFYINYLKSHPIVILGSAPIAGAGAGTGTSTISTKSTHSAPEGKSRKGDPPPPPPAEKLNTNLSESGQEILNIKDDLDLLEKRCFSLLLKTPPNGPEFVAVLQRLLKRENNWNSWKIASCPSFEKSTLETLSGENKGNSVSRKRSIEGNGKGGKKMKKSDYNGQSELEIKESARKLVANMPTYEEHIVNFIDAEDPENGIEAEYHPKNDVVYCWRARRLLANKHLNAIEVMLDGDLSKGLKVLNGDDKNLKSVSDIVVSPSEEKTENNDIKTEKLDVKEVKIQITENTEFSKDEVNK
jgi:THO complex subunit 1